MSLDCGTAEKTMARFKNLLKRPDLGYFGVGLDNCKNGYNVGGVIRAANSFGGRLVVVSGQRWQEKGNWRNMDAEGGHLRVPTFLGVESLIPFIPEAAEVVGVELCDTATNLVDFVHPKVGFYVFGPEDGQLSPAVSDACDHVVYIPTEYCLNLYSAVTAVLYDRAAKDSKTIHEACLNCGSTHLSDVKDAPVLTRHCNACGNEWIVRTYVP